MKHSFSSRQRKKPIPVMPALVIAALIALIDFLRSRSPLRALVVVIAAFVITQLYFVFRQKMIEAKDVRKMENAFPDFIDLVSSNLRAGMTVDRAMLLGSRKEFAPLDKEISLLGKDIMTGKEMSAALLDMAKRINSERISKTINVIVSGVRAGGDLAVLLEQTAQSMRERGFIEKRAASNVTMYVIFILFAVGIGAPLLFGFSSVLVEVLTKILGQIDLPTERLAQLNQNVPFAFSKVTISLNFITYFSLIFIAALSLMASLVVGLVKTGRESDGIKYFPILLASGIIVFFISRNFLLGYFSQIV
ncbi:hypothetical protein D6817_00270 [Candidatus Pacearchaeota archaeon]|nr:MAG: hypothetical protein D6817_00270 [Candidatus Pacearchaeota archaeon]